MVDIAPTQDATLYQSTTGGFANGSGEYVFVGRIASGERRRALFRFGNLNAVPIGATINRVELHFEIDRTISGAVNLNLFRMNNSWGEGASNAGSPGGSGILPETGDATWIHRQYPATLWNLAGGDFSSPALATVLVSEPAVYFFASTPALIADVQAWKDSPASNLGWMLRADESTSPPSAKRIHSREYTGVGIRPFLRVEFSLPPAREVPIKLNPAMMLGLIVLILVVARIRESSKSAG